MKSSRSGAVSLAAPGTCSSVLPYRRSGRAPWLGVSSAAKTVVTLAGVEPSSPQIWGGDWNQSFIGVEHVVAQVDGKWISDPDAYVIDVQSPE